MVVSVVEQNSFVSAMYKVGDDLRQDMLTLQMVRIMDKMWLKNGLDLKMVTFACVPTGLKRGFVKLITGAETLRRIQVTNTHFEIHFEIKLNANVVSAFVIILLQVTNGNNCRLYGRLSAILLIYLSGF